MRKAQTSGTGAAVLIALIAALIILYILFLPPSEREALLEGNVSEEEEGAVSVEGNLTLLLVTPGKLDVLKQKEIEHNIPSVNLYTTETAQKLKSIESVYIKNGWFDKQSVNFSFNIEDLPNTENVLLVFNIKKSSGRLIIELNGNSIYDNEVPGPNINPIALPREFLKEGLNSIKIEVSGVGIRFWKTNEYILEEVMITADVTDISRQESKNVFLVTSTEKDNLDRVFLKFVPECKEGEVAQLDILLNNHNIYSSIPDCGTLTSLEVSPHNLISGENKLVFRTTEGRYLMDRIVVKSELKERVYPTYYFEINESQLDDIEDGDVDAMLYIKFTDDVEYKKADVYVNGGDARDHIGTTKSEYELKLNNYINEEDNVIEIIPKTTLHIVSLKVVLEEK